MKIALVQMRSSADLDANLEKMRQCLAVAKDEGAQIVAFPEMAYFMARAEACVPILPRYAEVLAEFGRWAKAAGVYLLPGTLREPNAGGKPFNTLPVIDPSGSPIAFYRKIFLFKATLPDRRYDEAENTAAGNAAVVVEAGGTKLGLSICYDVRFPELFRALKRRGAECLFVPSSFTVPTGEAHWETLLRARAIENQCFVFAPAQVGKIGNGADTYGHSLVVSPWGEILSDLGEKEGVRCVTIPPQAAADARARVDAWASRRDDLFPAS